MLIWEEEQDPQDVAAPDDILDLMFSLNGRRLPVDHAYGLSTALQRALPWLEEEPRAGIHLIHVASSQNGWERPSQEEGQWLMLSRRTKLTLRLPAERLEAARQLCGQTLEIADQPLIVGGAKTRPLSTQGNIFARYIAGPDEENEDEFLRRSVTELSARGLRVKKALCGIAHQFLLPAGPLHTRSLLLAGLRPEESIQLQRHGLGPYRQLGCGLFLPHKGLEAVGKASGDAGT